MTQEGTASSSFLEVDRDTTSTAKRKLKEKTGVIPPYLEQLQSFSGATRDPRGWSVTQVYCALMNQQSTAISIDSVEDVNWVPVNDLDKYRIAFDHREIIEAGLERIRQKALYSFTPAYCLPSPFTITQLLEVVETILGAKIQRKTLDRRIQASEMFNLVEGQRSEKSGRGRKALMFEIKEGAQIVNFERNLTA